MLLKKYTKGDKSNFSMRFLGFSRYNILLIIYYRMCSISLGKNIFVRKTIIFSALSHIIDNS